MDLQRVVRQDSPVLARNGSNIDARHPEQQMEAD